MSKSNGKRSNGEWSKGKSSNGESTSGESDCYFYRLDLYFTQNRELSQRWRSKSPLISILLIGSVPAKGLIEIGDDVLDILDADRDSDQAVGNSESGALRLRHRSMGH